MNIAQCGIVVDLALFVFKEFSNWKTQNSITWDFCNYICLEKWESIETGQPEK